MESKLCQVYFRGTRTGAEEEAVQGSMGNLPKFDAWALGTASENTTVIIYLRVIKDPVASWDLTGQSTMGNKTSPAKPPSRAKKPLLLYSTNTWLAFMVAQTYYAAEHYVWCTPIFDARTVAAYDSFVPPTSSPAEIYRSLYEEVRRGDRHSAKILENKTGILRGAALKKKAGIIQAGDLKEITAMVGQSQIQDYRPLIYVIPFDRVVKRLKEVPVSRKAHPLSWEYTIERLPKNCFDVLELLS